MFRRLVRSGGVCLSGELSYSGRVDGAGSRNAVKRGEGRVGALGRRFGGRLIETTASFVSIHITPPLLPPFPDRSAHLAHECATPCLSRIVLLPVGERLGGVGVVPRDEEDASAGEEGDVEDEDED